MNTIAQPAAAPRHEIKPFAAAAALTALGIVYGDIGTSPLYAFRQAALASGRLSHETILGLVSLILWTLIAIVSVKYAILIMRANYDGEGGIMALLALLDVRHAPRGSLQASLLVAGVMGAALLYGDGIITPAISVLSAIEGLKVDAPWLAPAIVPLCVIVLVGLFLVQRKGTAFIGNIFGPLMLFWFLVTGLLGIRGIIAEPEILDAISPHHALIYLAQARPAIAFAVLGAVFLAVTGGEAMYADIGHFGCLPIRLGWFAIVLPALALNYFGQGALLLSNAGAIQNPFYLLAPRWLHYPLVAFATVATIIASQSIISGAYSLTRQAIQLGFLPRMRVLHTASHAKGQIYMPVVNLLLAAGTLGAVIGFGSSDALGGAYGVAVSMLMAITTAMAALVARRWGFNLVLVIAVNGFFLAIDLIFVAANATKLGQGGWFPMLLAGVVAFLMLTWRKGNQLLEQQRSRLEQRAEEFITWVLESRPVRLPGAAAIIVAPNSVIPLALRRHLRSHRILHERVLLVSIIGTDAPRADPDQRARLIPVGAGITRVLLFYGFMEQPDVMTDLTVACREAALREIDPQQITFYSRRVMIVPTGKVPGMSVWRERVFAAMYLNANLPASYNGVPASQVVEVGLEVEI